MKGEMCMNETEKRRQQLLREARSQYRDKGIPAVHPRYRAAYQSLYDETDDLPENSSSFGIRTVLCILLFALFVIVDDKGAAVMQVDSTVLTEQIQKEPESVTTFLENIKAWND